MRRTATRQIHRHIYQPSPQRMPRWLWRVWVWF